MKSEAVNNIRVTRDGGGFQLLMRMQFLRFLKQNAPDQDGQKLIKQLDDGFRLGQYW